MDNFDLKQPLLENKVDTAPKTVNEEETTKKSLAEVVLDAHASILDIPLSWEDGDGIMDFVAMCIEDKRLSEYKSKLEDMLNLPGRQSRAAFNKLYDDICRVAYDDDEEEEEEDDEN